MSLHPCLGDRARLHLNKKKRNDKILIPVGYDKLHMCTVISRATTKKIVLQDILKNTINQ